MEQYHEIIRQNSKFMDHHEHFEFVLQKMHKCVKDSNLPILEVGLNKGGSSLCFMSLLRDEKKTNWLFTVDPYGQIPYHNGAFVMDDSEYPNEKYRQTMVTVSQFALDNALNHAHLKVTSEDFISMLPFLKIHDSKETLNVQKFCFIHLDGSHDPEVVKKEVIGLMPYIEKGGAIIVDDFIEGRFGGFWDSFFTQFPYMTKSKTCIPDKCVLEFQDAT